MQKPLVYIIIVNYNGKKDTIDCLRSLQTIVYPRYRIVLIDNGSIDNSATELPTKFPDVAFYKLNKNTGFTGANNLGISKALACGADHILLLNNDTTVDANILNELVAASSRLNHKGIFGAKIYYFDEPQKIWYAGAQWKAEKLSFIHVDIGKTETNSAPAAIYPTGYVSGCALFFHKDLISKIGGLDDNFFLLYEEADFCYRAKSQGYSSFVVPQAVVWHKVSRTFNGKKNPLYIYFDTRNKLLWGEKHLPKYQLLRLFLKSGRQLFKIIAPPRAVISGKKGPDHRQDVLNKISKKYSDPVREAVLLGMRDYIFRRFNDCPQAIRSLR